MQKTKREKRMQKAYQKWKSEKVIEVRFSKIGAKKARKTFHESEKEGNGIEGRLLPRDQENTAIFVANRKLKI